MSTTITPLHEDRFTKVRSSIIGFTAWRNGSEADREAAYVEAMTRGDDNKPVRELQSVQTLAYRLLDGQS